MGYYMASWLDSLLTPTAGRMCTSTVICSGNSSRRGTSRGPLVEQSTVVECDVWRAEPSDESGDRVVMVVWDATGSGGARSTRFCQML